MDTPSCEIFGHSYHETTGKCGYCEAVLPLPAKMPSHFTVYPTLPAVIKVHYSTIDRYSESRRFKTLKGARAYVAKRLGTSYDAGIAYAVSYDGVGKVTSNVPMSVLLGVTL
jgi:hypothetical protein